MPPQNEFQTDVMLKRLCRAVGEEEFAIGGVEAFAVHRVPGDAGAYQMYEQYTKAAAARHGTGPLVRDAWDAVLARMVAPFERVLLEPLGVYGARKEVGCDVTGDQCWRYTIRVAPESAGALEVIFDEIMDAMEIDEFPTGEVKTYSAHRIAGDLGRYVMYEHFTGRGSAQHAKGPTLPVPGEKQTRLMVTPFERVQLDPIAAFGTKHSAFGKSARKSVKRTPVTG